MLSKSKKTYFRDYYITNKQKIDKYNKQWSKANRDKINKRQRERRKNNHIKSKEYRLKYRFGITLEDYNQLFNNQQGCCAICGVHQSELQRALDIDHSHKTGEIRGLLCGACNLLLGNGKDNPEILRIAADYLEIHE